MIQRSLAPQFVYAALLAAAWAVAVVGGWTIGAQLDNYAYDYMFRRYQPPPWQTSSAVLAIDEPTLNRAGSMASIRPYLAQALQRIVSARPAAVAIDVVLADSRDEATDAAMERALRAVPNLVLDSDLIDNARAWEDPLPRFRAAAAAVGHVHALPDRDGVSRSIPLEKFSPTDRRWALALEAYRVSRGLPVPLESPADVELGNLRIRAPRSGDSRLVRVRYVPPGMSIPRVSMAQVLDDPSAASGFTGKVAHVAPYIFFTHSLVFSFVIPASTAWLATFTAAAWQLLVVRRSLTRSEAERVRYQQAMQFVTHEMRTPLTAIQGSSELISRYALTEEKRKQIALLINSESKRLARMIEVFLNVEKLSAGQVELKHETIALPGLIDICALRTQPLAERKRITVSLKPIAAGLSVTGDRELMEYACYNLLTNAVKYSPQQTEVTVSAWRDDGHVRIAVQDQGIGLDQKEVKKIFQKFYRTKKAEESGEAGTGIGLSIVQQIVVQHGGRIDVVSRPGEGSCFTLVLPAPSHSVPPTPAERP